MASAHALATQSNATDQCFGTEAVSQHLGLVYHVARALLRGCRRDIELDELVSVGTLGLIDALAHFDAARGLSFATFAMPRIRGAMLDELRRQDHVPRSVRRRARVVADATAQLTRELGALPNAVQLAGRLGIDRATLWRWQSDSSAARTHPLAIGGSDGDARSREEFLEGSPGTEVEDAITQEQELAALQSAIRALGSRERTVLTLYYYEELRLHQIAEVLGVTESRVSQIRAHAVAQLRDQLSRLRHPVPVRHAVRPRRLPPCAALR
jgi:RNA polymerase sigma factor for flagellar operon FliA